MIFVCYAGGWKSLGASLALSLLLLLTSNGNEDVYHLSLGGWRMPREPVLRRHALPRLQNTDKIDASTELDLDASVWFVVVLAAAVAVGAYLCSHRHGGGRAGGAPAAELSQRDADAMLRRLSAMPIVPYRTPKCYSNQQLSQRLAQLGVNSAGLERAEAEAKLSERVDKTCCVCQEDFEEGMPLRSLVRCRHVYHVECIDRWAYSEMGKGRLPKCPLCNTHL